MKDTDYCLYRFGGWKRSISDYIIFKNPCSLLKFLDAE